MEGNFVISDHWNLKKKFFFLFLSSYCLIYLFPFPFDSIPYFDLPFIYYYKAISHFTLWIGKSVLQLRELKEIKFTYSGDTTFDFVKLISTSVLSLLISVLILILDKGRVNYKKLHGWLIIYLRYCLGFYMLMYGFDKVFKSHFPFPNLFRLEESYGNSSPQGLLWTFMGYSSTYSVFIGCLEVLSGFLLFFRRTFVFGALFALLILVNVTLINFSYDVPVKLFALHIDLFCIILLWPYITLIFHFFFSQKTSLSLYNEKQHFPVLIERFRNPIKLFLILIISTSYVKSSILNMRTFGDAVEKPPLYGIYETEVFKVNSDTISTMTKDSLRWDKLIIDPQGSMIRPMEGNDTYYSTETDTINKILKLHSFKDPKNDYYLRYSETSNSLTLSGKLRTDSLFIILTKKNLNDFLLLNRGCHWINNEPMNR
jgi:hypothetical protein